MTTSSRGVACALARVAVDQFMPHSLALQLLCRLAGPLAKACLVRGPIAHSHAERGQIETRPTADPSKAREIVDAVPGKPWLGHVGFAATRSHGSGYDVGMSETALLVIDMFNSYSHPDAEELAENVGTIIDPLADLVTRSRDREDVDVIYVNDNYGDFTADIGGIVDSALNGARPDLIEPLTPGPDSQFLLKVRHSAFYATPLDYLLSRLGVSRIVLTGQVTEQCVLYTALDGYVRHYEVVVPPDAVAHIDSELGKAALTMMQRNMKAELSASTDCLP